MEYCGAVFYFPKKKNEKRENKVDSERGIWYYNRAAKKAENLEKTIQYQKMKLVSGAWSNFRKARKRFE
jgi:hypothetical protein